MDTLPLTLRRLSSRKSESTLAECVHFLRQNRLAPGQLASLAELLAKSGEILDFGKSEVIADVASTGGPSSLSTLLCPLYLRHFGVKVVKLTVPGRPAGSIDTMSQIHGYRIDLSRTQVHEAVARAGFAHYRAGVQYCPLDARLYYYRKRTDRVDVPQLAIASILAKKCAAGITRVGLDVRVAKHGNFGETFDEARANARLFVSAAEHLGIVGICFLTDGRFPCQPYIGRAEALRALGEIFTERASGKLQAHSTACIAIAATTAGVERFEVPTGGELRNYFALHLAAQDSAIEAFEDKIREASSASFQQLLAEQDGFVEVDLERLRSLFVAVEASSRTSANPYPDTIGIVLACDVGQHVERGELLAKVRITPDLWTLSKEGLRMAITVKARPTVTPSFEVVENGS